MKTILSNQELNFEMDRTSLVHDKSASLTAQKLPRLVNRSTDFGFADLSKTRNPIMVGSRVAKGYYKGGTLAEYLGAKAATRTYHDKREWMIKSMVKEGDGDKLRAEVMK